MSMEKKLLLFAILLYVARIFGDKDVGEPAFLTPLIKAGNIEAARNLSIVQHEEIGDIVSFSGYFTVNENYGTNSFFWFFPAENCPETAPILLWLQGGPGATSLVGLFTEHGPFSVTSNLSLEFREHAWTKSHSLIYLDNPAGAGFSFTRNENGYATNQTRIGEDVVAALEQFFKLFPECRKNDFFVAGESYAGKYVPAVSYAIHNYNARAKHKINMQGLMIGNGFICPEYQMVSGEFLYQLGMLDSSERDIFVAARNEVRRLIRAEKFLEGFPLYVNLVISKNSLFVNFTGSTNYYDFSSSKYPNQIFNNWPVWLQRADVRRALHVGNESFTALNPVVLEHLKSDVLKSTGDLIANLTNHYRILLYFGQQDIVVGYRTAVDFIQNLVWSGAAEYKTAKKNKWRVDGELAGYSKTAGNLTEVLVRDASHLVPVDQPLWALDLISRFTRNKPLQ